MINPVKKAAGMLLLGPDPVLDQRTRRKGEKISAGPFDVINRLMEAMHVKSDPHKSGFQKTLNNHRIPLFPFMLKICGLGMSRWGGLRFIPERSKCFILVLIYSLCWNVCWADGAPDSSPSGLPDQQLVSVRIVY